MHARRKLLPLITSLLVALAGFTSLAQVLTVRIRHHQFGRIDDSLLPFTPVQNSHLLILGVGLLLLYISLQIYRRKRSAFLFAIIGLFLLIAAELADVRNIAQLAFYVLLLALLLTTEREYTVEINNFSLRRGVIAAIGIIVIVFIYATIGFSQLSEREAGRNISLPVATKYAAREVFTFQESQLRLRGSHARWFVASVNTASVLAYGLAIFSLFRPLQFRYGASRHDRMLASEIIEAHSTTNEDYMKLWPPDKHYFFAPEHDSFIAYKVVGSDAFVLGGPTGNRAHFKHLTHAFEDFSHRSGWSVAYINTPEDFSELVGADYQRLFIGNEAVIDCEQFATTTHRSKHFRYIRNRAERDGLAFEYWPAPLGNDQLARLRRISDAWLRSRSRREYTFALGYFSTSYLRNCDVAVLTRHGSAIAYANVLPGKTASIQTIDHMRYTGSMPPTGMHYLLMQLILHMHEAGSKAFSLGLAPLSGLKERTDPSISERILTTLKRLSSAYYSFEGLEQFKSKFEPTWEARYIFYDGTPARLLRLTRNLTRALSLPVAGHVRRLLILVMSLVAALCYASFPFAYFVNPHRFIDGLASTLGESGQSYAIFFNSLDVLAGILIMLIVALLWVRLRPEDQLARIALALLALSGIANILAAVTPLPARETAETLTQGELHDLFSGINLLGICGSAIALTMHRHWRPWLTVLLVSLLASSTIAVIGLGTHVGSIAQRCQIILASLWLIIISVVLSRIPKDKPIITHK